MNDQAANLVLEHLRAMRVDMSSLDQQMREHGHRLNRIEIGVAALRRDQAGDAESVAHLEARTDRLRDDVERIKRRLELEGA